MFRAIAADVGGSFLRLALVADGGTLHAETRVPTPADDRALFVDHLDRFCRTHDPERRLPFGLSIAGVFDVETGTAVAANIPCLNDWTIEAALGHALGRPVAVANDADCFALGEATEGAGRGAAVVFGAILGSGVGGGLVVGGRLVPGAGEWGHAPVIPDLPPGTAGAIPCLPCGCGQRGCLDTVGGAHGLVRIDAALHGFTRTSQAIIAGWRAGEAQATATVGMHVDAVGRFLALVVNTVAASIVPVGGGLGTEPALVAAIDRAVRARILRRFDHPLVVQAAAPDRSALLGAAQAALQSS